jgi:hypothetical protein
MTKIAILLTLILATPVMAKAPPPKREPTSDRAPKKSRPVNKGEDLDRPRPVDPGPHLGRNAVNCTARRRNCADLSMLCKAGGGQACRRAKLCWAVVEKDCGE